MENIPNGYYRTSIKALILNPEKKFLLFKEENGIWDLPGGGLDYGEKPKECIIRELKEESGLRVEGIKETPSYFVTGLNSNEKWKAIVLYETTVADLTITPSDECVEVKFFSKEEALNESIYPTVVAFVNEYNPDLHQ